jgi:hypothetical protein
MIQNNIKMENITELPLRISIRGCYFSNFRNNHHFALHRQLHGALAKVDLKKLHIDKELMDEWEGLIEQSFTLGPRARIAELTRQMGELNARLTEMITYIFGVIRAQRFSFDKDMSGSALRLYNIIRSYRGLQKMLREGKSARIESLLGLLDEKADDVRRLGLTASVAELGRMNNELSATFILRANTKVGHTPAYKLRPELDRIFSLVVNRISASYVLAKSDADKLEIIRLVVILNRVIADFRRSYHESMAQRRRDRSRVDDSVVDDEAVTDDESDSLVSLDSSVEDFDSSEAESSAETLSEADSVEKVAESVEEDEPSLEAG